MLSLRERVAAMAACLSKAGARWAYKLEDGSLERGSEGTLRWGQQEPEHKEKRSQEVGVRSHVGAEARAGLGDLRHCGRPLRN